MQPCRFVKTDKKPLPLRMRVNANPLRSKMRNAHVKHNHILKRSDPRLDLTIPIGAAHKGIPNHAKTSAKRNVRRIERIVPKRADPARTPTTMHDAHMKRR